MRRFKQALERAGVHQITSSGIMNTIDGGIVRLDCFDGRCYLQLWDPAGAVVGSFPGHVRTVGGQRVYSSGRGSTQVGGLGDPEYTTVRATRPWHVSGSLDRHGRGTSRSPVASIADPDRRCSRLH